MKHLLSKRAQMKKTLLGVLAAMLVLGLLGCPNNDEDEDEKKTETPKEPGVMSSKMQELAETIKSDPKGTAKENPVTVKIGPDVKVEDLAIEYPDFPGLYDGIGGLFQAFGDKYVELDLTNVTWTVTDNDSKQVRGIPGASSNDVNERRPNRDKLVSVKLPPNLVIIEARAFVGCDNLKALDLKGQSKLEYIDEYAFFRATNLASIDFTGCTALKLIGGYAFAYAQNLEMLDLTPCTSLKEIGGRSFRHNYRLKYVEFPANLVRTGDYSMDYCYSLRYIRFRTPTVALDWGWSTLLYSQDQNGSQYNGLPVSHRMYAFESRDPATMQMYVIYHPNTIGWSLDTGTYYADNQEREYHQGHHVPLPYSGNANAVYSSDVDALRGEALLSYNDPFRGQDSVTVNVTGLNSHNGRTVKANIGNKSGTITAGAINLTIPAPTDAELQVMNESTFQAITGTYDDGQFYNSPKPNDNWTSGTYSGTEGKPWVWEARAGAKGTVKFAVLDLSVQNAAGVGEGKLLRYGKSRYKLAWIENNARAGQEQEDVRVIRYVYVDKAVDIFRYNRPGEYGTLRFVYLSLKKGWNQIEVKEEVQDSGNPSSTRFHTSIFISGGIIADNSGGIPDIRDTDPQKVNNYTNIAIPFVQIPWVIRTSDPWTAIVSPTAGPTLQSAHRNN